MKIKGYWEIVAKHTKRDDDFSYELVIKARTIKKAIKIFYTEHNCSALKNNVKVISIRPLEVEVKLNENNTREK